VLRSCRDTQPGATREGIDAAFALSQLLQDLQPVRMTHGPGDKSELLQSACFGLPLDIGALPIIMSFNENYE
jgi:hypothetical protein